MDNMMYMFKKIHCEQGALRAVRYNVDGSYVLTCGANKKLKLWNPKSGLLLKTYSGHGNEITDACSSCESAYIVTASLDKSIIYWDVADGKAIRRLRCHAGGVTCCKFNEDSRLVVSGSRDHMVMCWDIRVRQTTPIQTLKDAKDTITSLIITDSKIVSSSLDGCIRFYDIRKGELAWYDFGKPCTFITQTKDDQYTLTAFSDSVLRLIDNERGDILSEYSGHRAYDYEIECGLLKNDTQIITGTADGTAIVYDLFEEKQIHFLKIGEGVINSLTTHPNEEEVIFGKGGEFQLWGVQEIIL